MNEFQIIEEQEDLQALKDFVPSWETTKIEPFIHDTPVIPPTWNKVDLSQNNLPFSGDGSSGNLDLIQVIAGKEDGGTFVPGLVNAIGPFTEL